MANLSPKNGRTRYDVDTLIGEKIGNQLILGRADKYRYGQTMLLVRCVCGNERPVKIACMMGSKPPMQCNSCRYPQKVKRRAARKVVNASIFTAAVLGCTVKKLRKFAKKTGFTNAEWAP